MSMSDHEERLRIMALALRKGLEVRGPEAVSILEDAADFIEFMYEEVERYDEADKGSVGPDAQQACVQAPHSFERGVTEVEDRDSSGDIESVSG
jgi:hypothetical protein